MTDAPTKRCATCGEVKPVTLFSKNKQHPDGLQSRCKACVSLENKRYLAERGDAMRARRRETDNQNREARRATKRAYREANQDQINQNARRRYAADPETHRQKRRDYLDANADAIRARRQAYREANAQITEKRCLQCGEVKSLLLFSRNEYEKDGYRVYCKSCVSLNTTTVGAEAVRRRNISYRTRNKEKLREYDRNYRKNNPDVHRAAKQRRRKKVRENGGVFTSQELIAMRAAQNGVCAYCQYQHDPDELTIDHVIPILQGGPHEAANIVLACAVCNAEKGGRTPAQWRDRWYLREQSAITPRRAGMG